MSDPETTAGWLRPGSVVLVEDPSRILMPVGGSDGPIEEAFKAIRQLIANQADEIERLRGIVVVAKAYALGYLQDEAADRDLCISELQHELAQSLCQRVKDFQ